MNYWEFWGHLNLQNIQSLEYFINEVGKIEEFPNWDITKTKFYIIEIPSPSISPNLTLYLDSFPPIHQLSFPPWHIFSNLLFVFWSSSPHLNFLFLPYSSLSTSPPVLFNYTSWTPPHPHILQSSLSVWPPTPGLFLHTSSKTPQHPGLIVLLYLQESSVNLGMVSS